jgi:multidrug efflux pump subunit AcrA (membrane-fusion protein)
MGFRRPPRSRSAFGACLALALVGLALTGCQEVPSNLVKSQPYTLEPVKGTDLNRVKLSDEIAKRIDVQTVEVRADGKRKIVPHLALIYNPEGKVYVYTRPKPETYVRAPVKVDRVVGDRVLLSDGPPAGTVIVTVGAAELLATEYEILNQHP